MPPPAEHKTIHLEVREAQDNHKRADKFIAEQVESFSRSQFKQRLVKLLINGKESKLSQRLKQGDRLEIVYTLPPRTEIVPENIPLDILYENPEVVVLNKPQGLAVHPGSGRQTGTLVNALVYHFSDLKTDFADEPQRPGIVHRLDKDTSGVLIVAKNKRAHEYLADLFRRRAVRKNYLALVKGTPSRLTGKIKTRLIRDPRHRQRFTWAPVEPPGKQEKTPARGKVAVTFYKVLRVYPGYALVLFKPLTGRTHQLRVHALYLGCPILGDPLYSRPDKTFPRATLMLHAYRIMLSLPPEKKRAVFKAPLPDRFKEIIASFKPESKD